MSRRWGLCVLAVLAMLTGCADRDRPAVADGRLAATPGGLDFQRVAIFDGREAEVVLRNVGRSRIIVDEAWVEGPAGAWQVGKTKMVNRLRSHLREYYPAALAAFHGSGTLGDSTQPTPARF